MGEIMAVIRKSSKKKKIIIAVVVILVVAIIVAACLIYRSSSNKESVSLYTISTSDIYETVDATGEISSGATMEYSVSSIATVKDVYVKTGDEVKEGDLLATFDTSTLDEEIESLQNTYNKAQDSYANSIKSQSEAKSNLKDIEKQISSAEKKIAKLEKSMTSTKATTTTKKSTTTTTTRRSTLTTNNIASILTTTTSPSTTTTDDSTTATQVDDSTTTTRFGSLTTGDIGSILTTLDPSSLFTTTTADDSTTETTTVASIQDLIESLNSLVTSINSISTDLQTAADTINVAMQAFSEAVAKLDTSSLNDATIDSISKDVANSVTAAIQDNVIDESNLLVSSDEVAKIIETAVKNIDWENYAKAAMSAVADSDMAEMSELEINLAKLYIQKQMYTLASSDSTVETQKELLDTSEKALDTLQESSDNLSAGWTAAFDGTITSCSITPGEQVSLLSDCITLQNLNSLVITISLNEYDIHKVEVGMPATITTAYGEYTGNVISKGLVATGGSTGSILDNIGSIAGISGLSSLTETGAGVEVQISVDEPDENIIVGFDANVVISTGEYLGVTTVPIESILLEKTGTFVYLYDEEEETVTKTPITTGAISDSVYEVTSGLSVGDKIVSAPSSTYEDDTFKVKVSNS